MPYVCSKCEGVRKRDEPDAEPNYFEHWSQRCPTCTAFSTLSEAVEEDEGVGAGSSTSWVETDDEVTRLGEVPEKKVPRILTNTREFDRVLGGGLVVGSTVLIGGDPGIGKSTLLLQTNMDLVVAETTNEKGEPDSITVLYVSAEETKIQIQDRAKRLGWTEAHKGLLLYSQNDVYKIERTMDEHNPDVLVIDSIQRMLKPDVDGNPGTVTQVRESAAYLVNICKARDVGCFMVAHVTKGGELAGPKTLEHLVDAVLEFGQEGNRNLRRLRAEKNRFGSTDEMGLFKMTEKGLSSVENPSELLLAEHMDGVPGVAIAIALEGNRPMAVEVQALKRKAVMNNRDEPVPGKLYVTGLSKERVSQILAILEERCHIYVDGDLYVNVAGGISLRGDPGVDLAVALAVASSVLGYALPEGTACVGELGLAGEVRTVQGIETRVKAARLLEFETLIGPVLDSDENDEEEDGEKEGEVGKVGAPTSDDDFYVDVIALAEVFEVFEWETEPVRAKKTKKPKKKPRAKAPAKNAKTGTKKSSGRGTLE